MGKIYDALKKAEQESRIRKAAHRAHDDTASAEDVIPAVVPASEPTHTIIAPAPEAGKGPQTIPVVARGIEKKPSRFDREKQAAGGTISDALFIVHDPHCVASEQIRMLRSRIFTFPTVRKLQTLLITSCLPGEGKSTIAANLAVCIAGSINQDVLLADCDLRAPSIHHLFKMHSDRGLSDCLIGHYTLPQVIIKSSIPHVALLASGRTPHNPSELLSSEKMKLALDELKTRFSDGYIILDSTPILQTPETGVLAEQADSIILVIQSGKAGRELVMRTINNLGKDRILGIVFNRAREPFKSYYYSYYSPARQKNDTPV